MKNDILSIANPNGIVHRYWPRGHK